jgi:hypothetical protein
MRHDLSHHSSNSVSAGWGANCCIVTQHDKGWSTNTLLQRGMILADGLLSPCSWSHKRHHSGWGRPRCASWSAVQHLSWATSHRKNLHFPGAQLFPNSFPWPKLNWSLKNILIGWFYVLSSINTCPGLWHLNSILCTNLHFLSVLVVNRT